MAADKQHAHDLIEKLEANQVSKAVSMLESMLDPVSRAIANAPIDDEPVTEAGKKALEQSREWLKHHKAIPHGEVLAEFGLIPSDLTTP